MRKFIALVVLFLVGFGVFTLSHYESVGEMVDDLIIPIMPVFGDGWYEVDDSLATMEIKYETETVDGTIEIYRITPGRYEISLENDIESPHYLADWAENLDAAIVINGGYFHEDYTPSGYLKVDFNRIGERLFDQQRSGLLLIEDDQISIRDLSKDPLVTGEELEYGLQSYPFFIQDSVRAITADSGKLGRRTAVGTDHDGYFYIIIVDDFNITLYALMEALIDTDIDFEYVLNLDGGPSSGIIVHRSRINVEEDSIVRVPNVVVFSEKN
ncbi:phosphodiester glycosidase family protein [Patescibacteria group bacterium]|nr:phosphodiester glycosidase family protein [Patescibacteria group bacterium]